ncbi:MAG: hypothetical protein M1586_00750 [Patescibacteria group bacterium]|nr:hypothetical protein [Patescibacteria group bacterium]MCL5261814.1 hypothetical protein [Patescibacteria group bacterium]
MPKNNNYIFLGIGLLFAMTFIGADIKVAKADYVDYVNGQEVMVHYNKDTGKLDLIDLNSNETIASNLDFMQDASGRGVPSQSQINEQLGSGYQIQQPPRTEVLGTTDSSERAETYSCTQVGVCGTTVIGYSSNPSDPNYALYNDTSTQEIITVYLRDSGQAQGNEAWEQAGGSAYSALIDGNQGALTSDQVNAILEGLGADFRVAGGLDEVSRKDLLQALRSIPSVAVNEEGGPTPPPPAEPPARPVVPPAGPVVPPAEPVIPPTECTFTAVPTEILYSKSTKLTWSCNQTDSCAIQDDAGHTVLSSLPSTSSYVSVSPLKTTGYSLNCSGGKSWNVNVRVFSSGIQ